MVLEVDNMAEDTVLVGDDQDNPVSLILRLSDTSLTGLCPEVGTAVLLLALMRYRVGLSIPCIIPAAMSCVMWVVLQHTRDVCIKYCY